MNQFLQRFWRIDTSAPFRLMSIGLALAISGCDSYQPIASTFTNEISIRESLENSTNEPIQPLVAAPGLDTRKVHLGKQLFHDVRLSKDNSISCATCHKIADGGDDGLATAIGIGQKTGSLNTPSVLNSSLFVAQFWDGRVQTIEQQIPEPVHNPIEMGTTWREVIEKLSQDTNLTKQFRDIYGETVAEDLIIDAIASYERALVTVNSPFDNYLRGDDRAISDSAKQGYQLFQEIGCVSCHQGRAVGGNMFQTLGIMDDYFKSHTVSETDKGRFNVTKRNIDMHRFKVPSLRNVALTAPYFHNGLSETLEETIATMANYQLGTTLPDHEIELIVAFLHSLSGEVSKELQ